MSFMSFLSTIDFAFEKKMDDEYYVKNNFQKELKEINGYNDKIQFCLKQIKNKNVLLEYIPLNLRTNEILFLGISVNDDNLKYITNKTYDFYLEAIKYNGLVLKYIYNEFQNENICLEAVKNNGLALEYVNIQTPDICLEAVKNNGLALEFIKNQTEEICLEALNYTDPNLKKRFDTHIKIYNLINNKTNNINIKSVSIYPFNLKNIKIQTNEICLIAVRHYGEILKYVKNPTPEICLNAFENILYGKKVRFETPNFSEFIKLYKNIKKPLYNEEFLLFKNFYYERGFIDLSYDENKNIIKSDSCKISFTIDEIFKETKEKYLDECCLCNNTKLYYVSFICGHECCLDCILKINKCYYKCSNEINFNVLYKNTN